ncbi:hypothetical protein [Streptomyces sp. Ru87]|uniref:hypothetical protein n=1 Tax=Streptomyces sp. Ru87 TaxID=2044307 RepID=UPI000BF40755|nr:hypothetical protein [Streptomyces sp. Ru87]PGH48219.1 hypothetical protein CRI70_24315 [Streptomyces sp. Ru87]
MSLAPGTALRWVEVLASAGVLVSSLEYLARPRALDDTSLASWPVLRLRHRSRSTGVTGAVLNLALAFPAVLVTYAVRAAAAAALAATTLHGPLHVVLLGLVVASTCLPALRGGCGCEGSDQVLMIVFCTLLLVAVHPSPTAMRLGLWFIALHACLAYCVSGIYKVTSRVWQDGTGLVGVLGTRSLGTPSVAAWLAAHPATARRLSNGVVLFETLFPLALAAPATWLPYFVFAGIGFHLCCAVLMGLNCFVWAFTATYPAIAYVVLR